MIPFEALEPYKTQNDLIDIQLYICPFFSIDMHPEFIACAIESWVIRHPGRMRLRCLSDKLQGEYFGCDSYQKAIQQLSDNPREFRLMLLVAQGKIMRLYDKLKE